MGYYRGLGGDWEEGLFDDLQTHGESRRGPGRGKIFSLRKRGKIVWEYDFGTVGSFIARAQKYSMDYLNNDFPNYVLGDVNFDDAINIMDVMITSDMFTGQGYLPTPPADYNQDGSVDQTEIELLLNQILY